jgi:hypothetical protein
MVSCFAISQVKDVITIFLIYRQTLRQKYVCLDGRKSGYIVQLDFNGLGLSWFDVEILDIEAVLCHGTHRNRQTGDKK